MTWAHNNHMYILALAEASLVTLDSKQFHPKCLTQICWPTRNFDPSRSFDPPKCLTLKICEANNFITPNFLVPPEMLTPHKLFPLKNIDHPKLFTLQKNAETSVNPFNLWPPKLSGCILINKQRKKWHADTHSALYMMI